MPPLPSLRRLLIFLLSLALAAPLMAVEVHERVILAPVYTVKGIYRSMMGPSATQKFVVAETEEPELLWMVGFEAEMVNADGTELVDPGFMCHSNLDIDISAYRKVFDWRKTTSRRLFTLSQGQYDVSFPEGFGIPLLSWQPLELNSQVLNLNDPKLKAKVRHRITIRYIKDSELEGEMTPLFMKAAQAMVALDEDSTHWGMGNPKSEKHGESCSVGMSVRGTGNEDKYGQRFSGHWVVPPGEHEYAASVTRWLNLPFDTRAHYIAVHLHPFAEDIELRDLTADRTVYRSMATNRTEGMGLDHVDYYSSPEGLELHRQHQYQIRTRYHNTSGVDQDSMAVMFFYVEDKEFVKPSPAELAQRLAEDPALKKLSWTKAPTALDDISTRRAAASRM